MTMWLMEGESCGIGDYQSYMAQVCAAQIRDWLKAGLCGEAMLISGHDARPVSAADISVLVRSRQEAALVRDALTQLAIPSVYLSNRDSVFETLEAQEMLWAITGGVAAGKRKYATQRAGGLNDGVERTRH